MRLQQTLENFGVRVTITDISQGPSVTRYELQPEQGRMRILSKSNTLPPGFCPVSSGCTGLSSVSVGTNS